MVRIVFSNTLTVGNPISIQISRHFSNGKYFKLLKSKIDELKSSHEEAKKFQENEFKRISNENAEALKRMEEILKDEKIRQKKEIINARIQTANDMR